MLLLQYNGLLHIIVIKVKVDISYFESPGFPGDPVCLLDGVSWSLSVIKLSSYFHNLHFCMSFKFMLWFLDAWWVHLDAGGPKNNPWMLGRQNRRRRRKEEKTEHLMLQLARISRIKAEMEFFSHNWAIHNPFYVNQNLNPCVTPSKYLFLGIMNEGILNTGILNSGVLIPPWYDVIWWGLNEG